MPVIWLASDLAAVRVTLHVGADHTFVHTREIPCMPFSFFHIDGSTPWGKSGVEVKCDIEIVCGHSVLVFLILA